jgi:gluconolactonase
MKNGIEHRLEMVAAGFGWPEGPTVLPDGRLVFVESYRSQLTVLGSDRIPRRFAYVAGAPNSCVLGTRGWIYVCQNGGTVGPWRAAEMVAPSIQRVREGGVAEVLLTEVEGVRLNGPNDLVFASDGRLVFTDPGTYNPGNPDPSYIHALAPDGTARVVVAFPEPVFPNGLVVEADGSIVWGESYTGHVRRRRPDGMIDDLGRLPGPRPTPDGMKIGAGHRLFVADIAAGGIRVLAREGEIEAFIPVGKAPTNCCFDGETLWVTDAGALADSTEPSSAGQVWRVDVPGGGPNAHLGYIDVPRAAQSEPTLDSVVRGRHPNG